MFRGDREGVLIDKSYFFGSVGGCLLIFVQKWKRKLLCFLLFELNVKNCRSMTVVTVVQKLESLTKEYRLTQLLGCGNV